MIYDHSRHDHPYVSVNTLINRQQKNDSRVSLPVQKRESHTDMTDRLRSGLEDWARMDISETRSYYHSDKAGDTPEIKAGPIQGNFAPVQRMAEIPQRLVEIPLQRKENSTGMPDHLKTGLEGWAGMDLSEVRVHYNSSKPSEIDALAYTQGTDIHVAPGQEKHLPHEAWHVVQQAQGRVRPTMQLKGAGVSVNDEPGLEREADEMGAQLLEGSSQPNPKRNMSIGELPAQSNPFNSNSMSPERRIGPSQHPVIQRVVGFEYEMHWGSKWYPKLTAEAKIKEESILRARIREELKKEDITEDAKDIEEDRFKKEWEEKNAAESQPVPKGDIMVPGNGFTVQGEVSPTNPSESVVEFVIEPQDTYEKAEPILDEAQKMAKNLRDHAGEKFSNEKESDAEKKDRVYQINLNWMGDEAAMQATAGIRLERYPALFHEMKWRGSSDLDPTESYVRRKILSKVMKIPGSEKLKGLLTLIAHYLASGKKRAGDQKYPKAQAPIMARTWFPKIFEMVPDLQELMQGEKKEDIKEDKKEEQAPNQVEQLTYDKFINLILTLPKTPWAKGDPFTTATFSEVAADENLVIPTREDWLKSIIVEKKDQLSYSHNPAFDGMGKLQNRTDVNPDDKDEMPIFEFRGLHMFSGIERYPKNFADWKKEAKKVFQMVDRVNKKDYKKMKDDINSWCFLTTACVEARNLPDDCEELTILRGFRDHYMKNLPNGPELIAEYYRIAPGIVAAINNLPNAHEIFDQIYAKIAYCVASIKAGKPELALAAYKNMVMELKESYCS